MEYFVDKNSIVREIWGKSDTILFVFAGASAEFALSKAVDWLYFTGKLPSDPIGRFLSTVSYAQTIAFAENQTALRSIDAIAAIHAAVEDSRGSKIPAWAYRDVLSMLIDYSIRSFELLQRKLTRAEKNEVFQVFTRMATRMGLQNMPDNFEDWETMRAQEMRRNLELSSYTVDLFKQYRKKLGLLNYLVLLEAQKLVMPETVRELLGFQKFSWLSPFMLLYKHIKIDKLKNLVFLFSKYRKQIGALNVW